MSLAGVSDATVCYVEGYGQTTVGMVRASEESPALDDEWEATVEMWGDIVTRNLCRQPWDPPGATPQEIKAFHVSRYLSAQTRRAST